MSETTKFRPRHSHYCAAISCYNSRAKKRAVSFFRFPKEQDRCAKWVENCRREDMRDKTSDALHRNYVLCSDHFEDSQFMNSQAKNKLVWNAIPTLFNIPDPPLSIAEEKARGCPLIPPSPKKDDSDDDIWEKTHLSRIGCNTSANKPATGASIPAEVPPSLTKEDELPAGPITAARPSKGKTNKWASVVLTPQQLQCVKSRQTINRQRVQIWRLKKQVQVLKAKTKKRHTVDDIIEFASKYMSGVSHDFFANQLRMASKKDHGKRWTEEDKFFALMLNCISVEAYRLCSKVFNLPSIRSLQRWLKGFKQEAPDFGVRLRAYKQKLMQGTEVEDKSLPSACTLDSGPVQMSAAATQSVLDSLAEDSLDSAAFFQTLLPMDERNGDCLDETKLRVMMAAASGGTESSLPLLELTEISSQTAASLLSEVVAPKRARRSNVQAGKVRAPRQKRAKKLKATKSQEQQQKLELLASLSTLEPHQPQEVHMELQSEHLTLDPQTFQLLASAGHLGDGTTFTAVQEVNTEGTVTLTPITNGMPVTLASDTINLEIVTLDVARETLSELGLTEQIV